MLYLKHIGEMEARKVSPWDRFVAYQSLELFVTTIRDCVKQIAVQSSPSIESDQSACNHEIVQWLTGEDCSDFERATAILAARIVNHPPGPDPRLSAVRDSFIWTFLHVLSGYGLSVTSSHGDSLTSAMSEATGISERTISRVWEEAPVWLRSDKRSRKRFADVPCAQCGSLKVPVFRVHRDGAYARCYQCSPTSVSNCW